MDWSEDLGFEEFFTRVLNRTEEFVERIVRSDDEEYRSSVHSHVDLLERTAILPVQYYRQYYLLFQMKLTCRYLKAYEQFLFSCLIHF